MSSLSQLNLEDLAGKTWFRVYVRSKDERPTELTPDWCTIHYKFAGRMAGASVEEVFQAARKLHGNGVAVFHEKDRPYLYVIRRLGPNDELVDLGRVVAWDEEEVRADLESRFGSNILLQKIGEAVR
jgi:hypothetical protein